MEEVIVPILNTDPSNSAVKKPAIPDEKPRNYTRDTGVPVLPFFERIESWLEDAGPREQLLAVALDLMLTKKDNIQKVTGHDVYQDMIQKYRDTVCRIAGGSETLDKADDDDKAMAAALAALIAFS
jgi:hypothetical protein